MSRLLHFVLRALPTSPAAARALAAAMADWRHESERASSAARRWRVALGGVASVARVLAGMSLKELPGAWRTPFLWRTALATGLLLISAILLDPPVRFAEALHGWDLVVLAIARAAPTAIILMPLAAFLSEAIGHRTRLAPSVGVFALMAFVVVAMVSVLPEIVTFQAHVAWTHFANAATPPPMPLPSVYRLIVGGATAPMTPDRWLSFGGLSVILVVAMWTLGLLAYQVRQRCGITAWLIGLAPFVGLWASTFGVRAVVFLVPPAHDVLATYEPVVWILSIASITVFPLLLAGLLARFNASRDLQTDSKVTA